VILLDAETSALHWMVANIPGTSLPDGQVDPTALCLE
jgi:hypothetical protein